MNIRAFTLVDVLGNQAIADECMQFVLIIEYNNFYAFPATWRARQQGISLSPDRKGAGADWVYYDPRALGG